MTTAILNGSTPKEGRAKKRTFRECLALFDSARPYRKRAEELREIADKRRAEYEKARDELEAIRESRQFLLDELKRLREQETRGSEARDE